MDSTTSVIIIRHNYLGSECRCCRWSNQVDIRSGTIHRCWYSDHSYHTHPALWDTRRCLITPTDRPHTDMTRQRQSTKPQTEKCLPKCWKLKAKHGG